MESKAKILGHPAHPILIVFPLGLLITSVIFDIIHLVTGNGYWSEIGFWMLVGGLIGGIIAGFAGFIDWAAIPDGTRAKRIGLLHSIGNVFVLVLFGFSWVFRAYAPLRNPPLFTIIFSILGLLLGAVTAWLGGEMVDRLGIGVDEGANMNAPSSLSGKSAQAVERVTPEVR